MSEFCSIWSQFSEAVRQNAVDEMPSKNTFNKTPSYKNTFLQKAFNIKCRQEFFKYIFHRFCWEAKDDATILNYQI